MRNAFRILRHSGGSYLFAIAVLALGCGISTAVFSLVHSVVLRPLPFPDQSSLRVIWKANPRTAAPFLEMAYPELGDLQQNVKAFSSVAVMPTTLYGYGRVLQRPDAEPVQLETAPVSHDFFRTLGVSPTLGRDFADADEHSGAAPVAILSGSVWRRYFHSDPNIVGRQIRLSGAGATVIGVMREEVDFPRGVALWVPLGINRLRDMRNATYLQAIARVRPGFTDSQVIAQTNAAVQHNAAQFPQFYQAGERAVLTPLPDYLTGSARPQLMVALGASLLLLIAACFTASNLFLSRALRRRAEIATRVSLGASAAQLARQFLLEGALAAVIAAIAGLFLAAGLIRFLVYLAPSDIPGIALAGIHPPVMLFAAALTLLTTIACSAAPVLIATRFTLERSLREGSGRLTASRSARRLQNVFTLAQTAVTVVLLAVSLLAVVSVRRILHQDTGFANRDAITADLPLRSFSAPDRTRFYATLLDHLRSSPNVTSAGAILLRPLEGTIGWEMHYQPEFAASQTASADLPATEYQAITPGYLQTVGTPILEGRDFSTLDQPDSPKTLLISRSLAEKLRRAGHNPLSVRIRLGRTAEDPWLTVVGVVADSRYRSVTTAVDTVYTNYLQTGIPVNYVALRGRTTPEELTALLRREVAKLDPTQALASVASIGELIDANTARARFNMTVLFTFGIGALLLAAAGIYSVVAESVSARRREIAIRTAFGAARPSLTRTIVRTPLVFVLVGEAIGCLGAIAAGAAISALLYQVSPTDPALLGSILAFVLAVSAIAAAIPAWAASGQEPSRILQAD